MRKRRFFAQKKVFIVFAAVIFLLLSMGGLALAEENLTATVDEVYRNTDKIYSGAGVFGLIRDLNKTIKARMAAKANQGNTQGGGPQGSPEVVIPPQRTEVLGYYAEDWPGDDRSMKSVANNEKALTAIATFSFQIDRQGNIKGAAPQNALKTSKASGIKTLALIHNWAGSSFSRDTVHNVLTNPEATSNTINNITDLIISNGYHGVNIDFENVDPADRAALNKFMARLSSALKEKNLKVTMSVPAKTEDNLKNGWSGAFDYAELGKVVDQLMIMTYDESWFGGPAGPVASYGWVEKVVKYTVSQVPKEKVLMGIGVYGYVWDTATGKSTRAIPTAGAMAKILQVNATVIWDDKAKVPYYHYWQNGKKHVVWFESNDSAALKLNLVKQYGLGGIAIWRLGFEADGFWSMVKDKMTAAKQ